MIHIQCSSNQSFPASFLIDHVLQFCFVIQQKDYLGKCLRVKIHWSVTHYLTGIHIRGILASDTKNPAIFIYLGQKPPSVIPLSINKNSSVQEAVALIHALCLLRDWENEKFIYVSAKIVCQYSRNYLLGGVHCWKILNHKKGFIYKITKALQYFK